MINCSTSCVDKFREVVITCTWLFVISGTAPMGICVKANKPKPKTAAVNSKTMSLFSMLNLIIFCNIINLVNNVYD